MTLSERSESKGHAKYNAHMPWFVYIARSRSGRLYVGMTTNPQSRVARHNAGRGARLAQIEGPFDLRYVSSPFDERSDARKREMQIKAWTRAKKEKLIRGEWV